MTVVFQMVLALRYLHKEKNIVHRDLTPNNIMLGENDKVTISMFNSAKLLAPANNKYSSFYFIKTATADLERVHLPYFWRKQTFVHYPLPSINILSASTFFNICRITFVSVNF